LFLTRLLTAAALIAAFLGALFWLDRFAFSAVVAAVVVLGGHEWATLSGIRGPGTWTYGAACAIVFVSSMQLAGAASWICGLAVLFWALAAPSMLARGLGPVAMRLGTGLVVLVPAGLAMAVLSPRLVLLALGLVWIADTGAYLAGRAFGRRKLAPKISPGKTWEGVAGGGVGTLIYAMICGVFSPDLGGRVEGVIWVPFLAGVLALFALSVIGDLFESALKRQAGVKDSGRLLPGHGGVLDRIDSATATLPLALLLFKALEAAQA
jgi:phosphatidate cytidylyltransferase